MAPAMGAPGLHGRAIRWTARSVSGPREDERAGQWPDAEKTRIG